MSDHIVLFIDEVAALLRTSTKTLRKRIKALDDLPPMLPSIDRRYRWTRAAVDAWLARPAHVATFGRKRGGWR